MDVLAVLSSRSGGSAAATTNAVAAACLTDPALLERVAGGFRSTDVSLLGDCAEVFTKVAEVRPDYAAPYASSLAPLLAHRHTRVRWEATHAIALVAALAAGVVAPLLPALARAIHEDRSIIVRDYTVDVVGNYAGAGAEAARLAYPVLKEALAAWNGKHAQHALAGLRQAALQVPDYSVELRAVAKEHLDDGRSVVRKAAKALLRAIPTDRT